MPVIFFFLIVVTMAIVPVSAASTISFVSPTPADQSHSVNDYIFVNVSYLEANFINVTFNLLDYNENILNSTTYLTTVNSTNYTGLADGIYRIQVFIYDNAPSMSITEMRIIALNDASGTYIEPGDFYTIFMNYLLGNSALTPFALIIALSLVCGYFQMPNKVFLIILTIISVMFGQYLGEVYYILLLFVVGFIIYRAFARIFQ